MPEAIKKSLIIIKDNPILTLAFVIYLIVLSFFAPLLRPQSVQIIVQLAAICLLMLTAAFFAGWFNLIKVAIANSKKNYATEEEKIQDIIDLRKHFFEAVPQYMLPVLAAIILYIVFFTLWMWFNIAIANKFIGRLDFLFNDIAQISQGSQATIEYLKSLPESKIAIIYYWQIYFMFVIGIFNFLMMFWASALYYAKNNSKNPFLALIESFKAIAHHPIRSFVLYLFIFVLYFIVSFLTAFFVKNTILSFIFLILFVYFVVFVVVLIFDYYESRFTDNSNNRTDCIRQDQTGD